MNSVEAPDDLRCSCRGPDGSLRMPCHAKHEARSCWDKWRPRDSDTECHDSLNRLLMAVSHDGDKSDNCPCCHQGASPHRRGFGRELRVVCAEKRN